MIFQVRTSMTFYHCNSIHGSHTGNLPAHCIHRLVPQHFDDILPANEDINTSDSSWNDPFPFTKAQNQPPHRTQRVLLTLQDSLQMVFSVISLCRQYPRQPLFEPNKFVSSTLLSKSCPTVPNAHNTQTNPPRRVSEPPFPFPNMTIYHLMTWMNSGSHQKSEMEVMCLVKDVIRAEDFNPRDLDGFSVRRSLHALDNHREHSEGKE